MAIVAFVVLVGFYELFGYLGSGALQNSEVPLWLRSVQATASIFQATATGLAFIVGGLFAYYRFFKEETYSKRLQPSVSAAVSRKDGTIFVQASAQLTNSGQTSVWLDSELTRLGAATRKAGIYGWTPSVVEEVFAGTDHVRPGETVGDEVWMEIPDGGHAAIMLELRVAKKVGEEETEQFLGWIARDIVNLVDIEGIITDASTGGEEREG